MSEVFSVQCFKVNRCVDCGEHLKTFGAVRCKECNMRRVGKLKRKRKKTPQKGTEVSQIVAEVR